MKILRLYADADGESHAEDMDIEMEAQSDTGRV